jgi:hypothetical protein
VRSHLVGALLAIAAPFATQADRGAFSVDAGAVLSAARVPPGVGSGDSVFGSLAGATLGARYAFRNYLEVSATAVWFQGAPFYNDNTSITTKDGVFVGQAQSRVNRLGGTVGAHYVTGLVWRLRVGAEVGWSRLVFERIDLVDVSDPSSPWSFGLALGDRTVDGIVVAPVAGLEWMVTDHLSFAITPRIDFLLGEPTMTAFSVPITASWSWYGWFR